jgi:hypothetical protein
LGGVASLIYLPIGLLVLSTAEGNRKGLPPEIGYVLIGVSVCMVPWAAVYAYLLYHTGRSLREQKRWKFIFVMAIVKCVLGGVLGIVLGVFTIIVLNRPSVQALFAQAAYPRDED